MENNGDQTDVATPADSSTGMGELAQVAQMRYNVALAQFLMNAESMSKRSILRAITQAVDLPVKSGLAKPFVAADYKQRGQMEVNSAALFAQLLDMRNLIQANLLTKKKQAEENTSANNNNSGQTSGGESGTNGETDKQ